MTNPGKLLELAEHLRKEGELSLSLRLTEAAHAWERDLITLGKAVEIVIASPEGLDKLTKQACHEEELARARLDRRDETRAQWALENLPGRPRW